MCIHSVRRVIGLRNQSGVCLMELSQVFFSREDLTVIRLPLPREFNLKYMVRRSNLFQDLTVKLISLINFSVKKRNFETDQWWNNSIVINIKLITSLQNSDPLSDNTAYGIPLLQDKLTSAAATEVACLSGKWYASVHMENRSVIVKIMLFSLDVIAKGPTKSIPTISQALLVYRQIKE